MRKALLIAGLVSAVLTAVAAVIRYRNTPEDDTSAG